MPARARRSVAPEEDPRIRRQELSHGVYSFKSVWGHYKKLGWTTRPGPELGYDHYYIKPGKNTKCDVEGEDYFYGEAAIVAYGMKEKIFGEVPVEQQVPRISTPRRGNLTARAAKRGSVSGSTCNSDSDGDGDDASVSSSAKRRFTATTRKGLQQETQRRSSSSSQQKQKQKRRRRPGGHALGAISITSGSVGSSDDSKSTSTIDLESSDDDESDTDFRVDGVDDEEEDEDDDSDDDSNDDSDDDEFDIDSEEDPNEDDIVVVNVGVLASKLKGNFQAKKREPRPLLSTGTKKRKVSGSKSGLKQENTTNEKSAKRSRSHSAGAGASEGRRMKSKPKHSGRSSQSASASKSSAPTSASSGKNKRKPAKPRRLSVETEPPSQPTTSQPTSQSTIPSAAPVRAAAAPTRASTAAPSPRHSFLSPSTPPQSTEKSRKQREVTPSMQGSRIYVESSGEIAPVESDNTSFEPDPPDFDDHSFEQPAPAPTPAEESTTHINSHPGPAFSASYPPVKSSPAHHPPNCVAPDAVREDPTPLPTTTSSTTVPPASSPVSVHLQLDEVLFPSQPNQTFRIKISSTESPKQTTISIEHVQTREQRECTFSDIRQLDGKMTHEVPEKAIFEALLRCLRSLQSAFAAAGDEAQREKFSTEELGKVDLLHVDSNVLCLQLMFPCYEFWQQKHRFMMKLVPTQARLKALVRELEEARRELVMTQERLGSALSRNQLIETECDQLRTLLHAYQEKEQAHQRLEDLHHRQQMRQELLKETQEAKVAAEVAPAQEEQHASPRKHPPAARKRDTRSFHARSGWLVSSNASTTLQASPDKSISWESIVETTDKYFQIADESSRVVRVLQTGTYQLNLNVTHESSMELGVWIRSFDATLNAEKVRKLEPTLVQFYDNKQRVSRLDQVVELSRYDQVSVHLAEIGAVEIRTTWMAHFAPQPNMFFLTFLDQELVYKDAGK